MNTAHPDIMLPSHGAAAHLPRVALWTSARPRGRRRDDSAADAACGRAGRATQLPIVPRRRRTR